MDYILTGTQIHQHLVWNKLVKLKTFSYNYGMKSVSLKLKEFQALANGKGEVKVYSATSKCGPGLSSFSRCFFPQETSGTTVENNAGASRAKAARGLAQGLFGLELSVTSRIFQILLPPSLLDQGQSCSLLPQPNS